MRHRRRTPREYFLTVLTDRLKQHIADAQGLEPRDFPSRLKYHQALRRHVARAIACRRMRNRLIVSPSDGLLSCVKACVAARKGVRHAAR
jgi:hypothetical protein